jgi:hypothetical protein
MITRTSLKFGKSYRTERGEVQVQVQVQEIARNSTSAISVCKEGRPVLVACGSV